MYSETVGLIGGFGAYATLDFFQRFLDTFSSDSERNYPHVYIDNDFTMPSRTRALLYGDEYDTVVRMIAKSLNKMLYFGADHIILICGTAHAFLNDVYKIVPNAQAKVLNIVEVLGKYMAENCCHNAIVVAAEGTLKNRVYESVISETTTLISPSEGYYNEIRFFIESVKRNTIDLATYDRWIGFLYNFHCYNLILGCTEFPVLIKKLRKFDSGKLLDRYFYFDPLEIALHWLKTIIK